MDKIIIELTGNSAQLDATIAKLENLGKVDKKNADQFAQSSKKRNDALKEENEKLISLQGTIDKVGASILAAFAVDKLKGIITSIFETRAEFQKFEAQLVTALGSNSAAQAALSRIQKFAAETPYSVKEITESFIKLANRGVVPANESLRKMGDLAAALGKPMEQVTEAILDINNTERWKELGIKVETSGNKITGTFKNQRVEMERSVDGAMKMVEAFGKIDGVAGGMAKQMETLGGKMSNLGDNWDRLMNNMGKSTEGVFAVALDFVNTQMDKLNTKLELTNQSVSAIQDKGTRLKASNVFADPFNLLGWKQLNEELNFVQEQINGIDKMTEGLKGKTKLSATLSELKQTAHMELLTDAKGNLKSFESIVASIDQFMKKTREATEEYIKYNDEQKKAKQGHQLTEEELKKLNEQRKKEIDLLDGLRKKLRDVRLEEQDINVENLKGEDKIKAANEQKRKRIENEYSDQVKSYTKQIQDRKRLNEAIMLLDEIRFQQLRNIDLKELQEIQKFQYEKQKTIIEGEKDIADKQTQLNRINGENESELYRQKINFTKKYYEEKIALAQKNGEDEMEILRMQKEYELVIAKLKEDNLNRLKAINERFESEEERHTLEMMRLNNASEEEIMKQQLEYAKEHLKKLKDDKNTEVDVIAKAENEIIELETKMNNLRKKNNEEMTKKMIQSIQEILAASLDAIKQRIEAEIAANQLRINNEDKIIETQKILAQKGYENTLAFEQKRRDDLVKQQLAEKEKLRKIKEFEILLNAVAKFAEENPRTALAKALGLLASTKAAETLFAEEGGVVGSGMQTARGRRHKSGRDRLVLAEEGEGIIPVAVMKKMGFSTKDKFNKFLKTPFKDLPALINHNIVDFTGVINEVKELKQVMMNKKELAVDWNGLDMRITELENGLRTVTTHKRHYL